MRWHLKRVRGEQSRSSRGGADSSEGVKMAHNKAGIDNLAQARLDQVVHLSEDAGEQLQPKVQQTVA